MTTKEVVLAYWKAMESNDFHKGSKWLSEDFECYWPQSSELIIGRKNFAEINTNYPANGIWKFSINTVVCEGNRVVSDVNGVQLKNVGAPTTPFLFGSCIPSTYRKCFQV